MLLYLRRYPLYIFLITQIILIIFYSKTKNSTCFFNPSKAKPNFEWVSPEKFVRSEDGMRKYRYDKDMPLIFIGGMPRSGTTLLRVLLDAHPDIRCGQEPITIPLILRKHMSWLKNPFMRKRLEHAEMTSQILDSAMSAYILEIIAKHGEPAPRLCSKDPLMLRYSIYLHSLFPNAKFIFLIRDGRAVVHSIISRNVTILGFDLSSYRQCFKKWNSIMSSMYDQCLKLGSNICLPVFYEQLVLHPDQWMHKILDFLNVSWNETVLHHNEQIKNGEISLSKSEPSTGQVIKPINVEALSKWVGQIPEDVLKDIDQIAPMLKKLGYDPHTNPPNYGKPDSFVMNNMNELHQNRENYDKIEEELRKYQSFLTPGA